MIKIHLAKLLGERKMFQVDLAKRTGIRANTINEIYHEFIQRLNIEHLDKICEVLNCRLDELIEYVPNDSPKTGKNLIIEEHKNRKKQPFK